MASCSLQRGIDRRRRLRQMWHGVQCGICQTRKGSRTCLDWLDWTVGRIFAPLVLDELDTVCTYTRQSLHIQNKTCLLRETPGDSEN